MAHLQGFVEHFIDRFIAIAAVDIDFNLSVAMIEVLRLMQSQGLLDSVTEDKLDLVDRAVFDFEANPKLRQHALAFLMDHTEGFEETDGRDDTTAAVLEKKGRGKKTKGSDKPVGSLHLTPMIKRKVSLQLETLTEFAEHHLEDRLSNSYLLAEACIALKKYGKRAVVPWVDGLIAVGSKSICDMHPSLCCCIQISSTIGPCSCLCC